MRYLDLETWNRKEHFKFFNSFEKPFFGITFEVDCTSAYEKAKSTETSFFLYYLHKAIIAVNEIEEFRYRIDEEDRVIIFDKINAASTISRPDETFGFSYIDYHLEFGTFKLGAEKEIERVRASRDLVPASSSDVVFFSSIPWINFTSVSHSRSFSVKDSVPKISFGKYAIKEGKKMMPVSVHVHHGLMDGYHVGKFAERFQELLK
jgi:chloramphenicol O-acetyltransferase type A